MAGGRIEYAGGRTQVDRILHLRDFDVWVYSRPQGGARAGGDLALVASHAALGTVWVLVADVTGHGSAVAPVAGWFEGVLRKRCPDGDLSTLFAWLNEAVVARRLECRFISTIAATWSSQASRLSYCVAGHRGLIHRKSGRGEFQRPGVPTEQGARGVVDLAFGICPETTYSNYTIEFDPGDLVLLFSDGCLRELAADGGAGGVEGLVEAASLCAANDAAAFRQDMLAVLPGSDRSCPPLDDLSLVLLARHSEEARPTNR